jgi:N-acetylmuramoyl-L-alanine amidase
MGKVIYIDPGHGGDDAGAVYGRRLEKNDNLRMCKSVSHILLTRGHTVLLTRNGDTRPTLEMRIASAIAAKADLFISVHRNSFTSPEACGNEIWVRYPSHVAAAATVLEEVSKVPHQANRGVKIGAYRVLLNAPMPAMLLELGFISNAQDNALYDQHFNDSAAAIAKGILAALDEPWEVISAAPANPVYRVQVGAFTVKGNAEAFLQTVRGMGLEAFLVQPEAVNNDG